MIRRVERAHGLDIDVRECHALEAFPGETSEEARALDVPRSLDEDAAVGVPERAVRDSHVADVAGISLSMATPPWLPSTGQFVTVTADVGRPTSCPSTFFLDVMKCYK